MTALTARDQPRLSPAVSLRLVSTGIGFRLMRSGVTVAVQALAVAFLVYVFAASTIDTTVRDAAGEQLAPYREADRLLTRLRQPDAPRDVIAVFADNDPDRLAEYRAWAQLGPEATEELVSTAQRWRQAERWAASLRDKQRATLLGDAALAEAADQLTGRTSRERFRNRLDELDASPPGGVEVFMNTVTQDRAALRQAAQAVRRGHSEALRELRESPAEMNRAVVGLTSDATRHRLAQAGFVIDAERLTGAEPFAGRRATATVLVEALQTPDVRRAVARRARVSLNAVRVELLPELLREPADAKWLAGLLTEHVGAEVVSADALLDYAHHARREARLADAVSDPSQPQRIEPTWLGLPPRTLLLVALSCLVCVAGITNAMMMSVTERFAEIATMKCLGARSGSVVVLFLVESAVLGVAGGAVGVALGLLLAAASGLLRYGTMLDEAATALSELALLAGAALVLGIVLSMIAAALPSLFAARLPPMAAMRVE